LTGYEAGVDSDLDAAMSSLTSQQREILELAKIQGLTIEEVSERTGLSGPAVKVTIHRVMKKLQKRFGGGVS
jgi:RNA polymerase sigma-70 factor (ECF subfamily)